MQIERPYFMGNKEWYFYNEKTGKFELTEKATSKAIESFKEFEKLFYK